MMSNRAREETLQVMDSDLSGVVWRMERKRLISGRVVDRFDKPLERIVIELRDAAGAPIPRAPMISDSSGAFTFTAIEPGTYTLDARELSAPERVTPSPRADLTPIWLALRAPTAHERAGTGRSRLDLATRL